MIVEAHVLICDFTYRMDGRQELGIVFTVLLAVEVVVLAWQRSRHRDTHAPRTHWPRPLVLVSFAFLACMALTVWLIAQSVAYDTVITAQAFCGSHYDPQIVVTGFGAVVNAAVLEAATFGAILAIFGLSMLFAVLSFLRNRTHLPALVS